MKALYFAAAAGIFLFAQAAQAEDHIVKMVSGGSGGTYRFEPKELAVKSGDTVTWVNAQNDTHDVMSEGVPENADDFESPMLEKKDQQWSHVFYVPGTYLYHCHPHAGMGMHGVIIVDKPSPVKGPAHHHDDDGESSSLTRAQAAALLNEGKPVYSCTMHEHVFSGAGGRCPVCGMNLEQVKGIEDGKAVFGAAPIMMEETK